ncbi:MULTISPECIES: hypothetical protein [Fusobacterium]|uniref:hypothetical protein n=1 Tax=Fusobacterium TaxID=848 RepID=UPI001476B2C2|nr:MULTISPECIES: hypothetical protein [Fusobacterium]NME35601.1 hypothetical protein [Fusobacterium sp. FSA-380-WT-3A]
MKRIFFTTNSGIVNGINGKIRELILVSLKFKKTFFKDKIILKETEVLGFDLNKVDVDNILQEMYLKRYNYNFIKLKAEKCNSISKEGFQNFLKNFESELMSNIQVEKIEDIDKKYNKVMRYNTVISYPKEQKENNFEIITNKLTDKEIKNSHKKIRLELDMKRQEYEDKLKIEEIEKIILKSLYYLQIEILTLEELEELIKIYNEYINKIEDMKILLADTDRLVRAIIHSICILEKIYMTNLRLKSNTKNKFKILPILSKKLKTVEIDYDILEKELIKCLLFKLKGNYTFECVSLSFYLTTPLRMSCFSYTQTVIALDELIKKEKKLDKVLKDSFASQQEYNKYLSGAKLLNDSSIKNFSEVYLKNTSDTIQYISNLYYIYLKYKIRDSIRNNYSDKAIIFYEKMNIEDFVYKEKILKNIELTRVKSEKINVILSEVEDFTGSIGKDFIIYLNKKIILKNIQNISLNLCTNKDRDSKIIKKQYISTSKELLNNEILISNDYYCLVKLLEIKNIENNNFYVFESQILLGDFITDPNTVCTHVFTFILLENDFNLIGKASTINYLF